MSAAGAVDIGPIRELVLEAGARALQRWGSIEAEAKHDQSLVTEMDREIEELLAEGIARLHPEAGFAGEEFGRRNADRADTWVCDPIDGTTNYVRGLPHWCVSLGLVRQGVAEAGVIWAPALHRLYWAVRGRGAYCNDVALSAPDRDTIEYEDLLCISTNSLKTLPTAGIEARLRCLGSIALELCLVAEGRAIGAVGLHEGIMDMAAAMCVCEEAGCRFRYLDGSPLTAGDLLAEWRTKRHFLAAPERVGDLIEEALRPAG